MFLWPLLENIAIEKNVSKSTIGLVIVKSKSNVAKTITERSNGGSTGDVQRLNGLWLLVKGAEFLNGTRLVSKHHNLKFVAKLRWYFAVWYMVTKRRWLFPIYTICCVLVTVSCSYQELVTTVSWIVWKHWCFCYWAWLEVRFELLNRKPAASVVGGWAGLVCLTLTKILVVL